MARYGWRWRTAFSEDFGLSLEVCNGFMKLIRALQGFMQVWDFSVWCAVFRGSFNKDPTVEGLGWPPFG